MSVIQRQFEVVLAGGRTAGIREAAQLIVTITRSQQLDNVLAKALSFLGVMYSLDDDFAPAVPL